MAKRRRILSLLIIGIAIFYFAMMSLSRHKPNATTAATAIQAKVLFTVHLSQVPEYYAAVGTIEPGSESNLEAQVSARITQVLVKAGDHVRQGQLLLKLDNRDFQARLARAREAQEAARARLDQASSNYQRMQTLLKKKFVTEAQFDEAKASYLETQANLNQANKAEQEAEIALGYCDIRAVEDGLVLSKNVDVGDQAAPGKVLLQIQSQDHVRLSAEVPESLSESVHIGDELPVYLPAIDLHTQGTVNEIQPVVDPNTRTFTVKVMLPADPGILSGMFGRVSIQTGEQSVYLVPNDLIYRIGQVECVSIQSASGVHQQYVLTGKTIGNQTIVLSGVETGDELVLPIETERN